MLAMMFMKINIFFQFHKGQDILSFAMAHGRKYELLPHENINFVAVNMVYSVWKTRTAGRKCDGRGTAGDFLLTYFIIFKKVISNRAPAKTGALV